MVSAESIYPARPPLIPIALLCALCLASIFAPARAHAQSVTTSVSSQEIHTQETLTYRVEIEGSVQGVEPTFSKNFRVVGQSTQTSINFINGQTTRKLIAAYELAPLAAGSFSTGSATVRFKNGKTSQTKAYRVTVTDAGPTTRQAPNQPAPTRQPPPSPPVWTAPSVPKPQSLAPKDFGSYPALPLPGSDKLHTQNDWQPPRDKPFVLPFVNKTTVTIGEPFLVEYLYLEPLTALSFEAQDMDEPEFINAWFQDVSDARLASQNRVMRLRYRGETYHAQIVRSYMVVAHKEGTFVIPPFGLTLTGFTFTQRLEPFQVNSPQMNVQVQAPPPHDGTEPVPPNVGRYSFRAKLRPEEARVSDTFYLDLTIQGVGVPSHVRFPEISLPNGFRKLSAPEKQRTRTNALGWLEVDKTQTLSFELSEEGDYEIPPITFQWYDPWDNAWKRHETKAMPLRVQGQAPAKSAETPDKKDDLSVSQTWLHELPDPNRMSPHEGFIARMRQRGEPWRGNAWYFFLLSLPILAFVGLIASARVSKLRKKTHAQRQHDSAQSVALRALKKCPPNDIHSFMRMDQIMREYLRARGVAGAQGATYQELRDTLRATQEEDRVETLIATLEGLEEARYGGADPVRFHALRHTLVQWLTAQAEEGP